MADFNISIPQPNTGAFGGNLLQGLSAIEGIKAARAQQALEQQLAPLRLQQAELGIQSQRQQMAQSAAAAGRAAFGFNQQLQALQAEKQRKTQVATAFNDFLKAEDAGVDAIAPAMGILNKDEFDNLQAAAQVRLAQIMGKMDPDNPQPELVKQFGQLSAMLPPAEGKRFDDIRNALPNKYREGLTSTLNDAALFGLAGENDKALKLMDDQIEAFGKDQNPAAQAMSKQLQSARDKLNEDTKPAVWATVLYGTALKSGDPKMAEAATKFLEERAPEKLAKTESETAKNVAAARKDIQELGTTPARTLNTVDAKIITAESSIPIGFTSDTYDVLKRFENAPIKRAGLTAKISDIFTNAAFGGDEVTKLRNEIDAIIKGDSFRKYAALNKGSSSDKDVKIAQGFNISATAKPEFVKQALTAIINTAERASRFEEAEKAWAREIGMIEKSKEDMDILGVKVNKGDNYTAFKKNLLKELDKVNFVDEIGRQKEQDQKETEGRTMESRRVQQGAGPDFTGNEQDSLLKAAEVLKRLRTQ